MFVCIPLNRKQANTFENEVRREVARRINAKAHHKVSPVHFQCRTVSNKVPLTHCTKQNSSVKTELNLVSFGFTFCVCVFGQGSRTARTGRRTKRKIEDKNVSHRDVKLADLEQYYWDVTDPEVKSGMDGWMDARTICAFVHLAFVHLAFVHRFVHLCIVLCI